MSPAQRISPTSRRPGLGCSNQSFLTTAPWDSRFVSEVTGEKRLHVDPGVESQSFPGLDLLIGGSAPTHAPPECIRLEIVNLSRVASGKPPEQRGPKAPRGKCSSNPFPATHVWERGLASVGTFAFFASSRFTPSSGLCILCVTDPSRRSFGATARRFSEGTSFFPR